MATLTDIKNLITEIRTFLNKTFGDIDLWFDKAGEEHDYKPAGGGWSISQVLEHIALTNHFLLILVEKGTGKALNNVNKLDLQEELKSYEFHRDKLTEVGLHRSFDWIRPEHMEPKGEKTPAEVREQLKMQLRQCHSYLDKLKDGEGVLYKTTMSVNGLGKIDVYEYIYFLAQHGQRHITQMLKAENEYLENMSNA
ncbi:MAG: hypothetical protein JWO44_440 [Bacteroidetes bacterium]|nr:hypothetical protein [Bacteroidota bacterium]